MYQNFDQLIHEAIQLELNIAKLYLLFHQLIPEDSTFWWQLVIEEENHAALLKTIEQMETSMVDIPEGIMPNGLAELQESNQRILKAMEDFENRPNRAEAFQMAYKIEISAGESHYNDFMKNGQESRLMEIFRILNRDDLDHARRILEYKKEHLDS
jgi:hypothetical protein